MPSNTDFAAVVFPWTYSLDDTAIIAAVKAATHNVSDVLTCAAPSGPSALLQVVSIENPALFNNTVHNCSCRSSITHPHVSVALRSDLTWSDAGEVSNGEQQP